VYNGPHIQAPSAQLLWKRCNGLDCGICLLYCSEGASQRLKDNINASKGVVGLQSIAYCCQLSFASDALVLGSCML
jgi:Pyruvate/2-oxoacid:ferredoxin oxidoreductase delta subunit